MSWLISRDEWINIYLYITNYLSELNFARDQHAADLLSIIISKHGKVLSLEEFLSALRGYELAAVVGCSETLHEDLTVLKKLLEKYKRALVVAADGAIHELLKHGTIPRVVATDLNGNIDCIKEASRRGSIVVVHAHGDNVEKLNRVLELEGPVIGSTQVEPRPNVHNFGGFTDGDRAVYMLYHAGYREILLAGFDFEKPSACPGKVLVNKLAKKKKLEIAKWLISLLEDRGLRVVNIRDMQRRPS